MSLVNDDENPVKKVRGRLAVVQWSFLAVVVAFGAYWVVRHWQDLADAWGSVQFWPVAGALVCAAVGMASAVPIWRTVLAGMDAPLGWRASGRIVLVGQLGKYIPGGFWPVVAQIKMAKEEGVSLMRSAAASLMSLIISIITSLALGMICLVLSSSEILRSWWWLALVVIPGLAVLHPKVIGLLGRLAGAVLKRPVEFPVLTLPTMLKAAAWALGGQIFLGIHFYLLFGMVSGDWADPLLAIGLYQLAMCAGIMVFFAAAGAGPRELILVAGSALVIGQGPALLASLLSRAALTVVDFGLAGIGFLLGRRRRPAADPGKMET